MNIAKHVSLLLVAMLSLSSVQAQISRPSSADLDAVQPQFQDLVRGRSDKINTNAARPPAPQGNADTGPPKGGAGFPGEQVDSVPNPATDLRDFTGTWARQSGPGGGFGGGPGQSATDPRPGKLYDTRVDANRICRVNLGINPAEDFLGVKPPRMKVYQNAKQLTFVNNNELRARRIYINQAHATQPVPSYNGDAVAHWEGNTLVVETIALKGAIATVGFDIERGPRKILLATPTLKVTERFTRSADGQQLIDEQTWEDSAVSNQPYTTTLTFAFVKEEPIYDWQCEDTGDEFGFTYGGGAE